MYMAKSKRVVGRTLRGKRKHVNKTYKKNLSVVEIRQIMMNVGYV
jgi:hypothetical protein